MQKISEINSPKFLIAIALAVSSLSFTAAFAVVATARAAQQPLTSQPTTSPVAAPIAPPARLVFQDSYQSLQVKNALLIQRALATQLTQLRQSKSAPQTVRGIAPQPARDGVGKPASRSQDSLSFQDSPPPRSQQQESGVSYITVRVAIAQTSAIAIGSSDEFIVTDELGQSLQSFPAMQAVWFAAKRSLVQVGSARFNAPIWVRPVSDEALFFVGDRWYRGIVQIIPQGDSLLIVNHVDLEQYLYSVVGSEMPSSWNFEALKAQTIAARSYALSHMSRPDSQWFDLTNTQRHQVYSGVSGETSESAAAVANTTGLVVTSVDGEIFEAMYASTDVVVARFHSGFESMSQTGAAIKADDGWNFAQILSYYYPNAALSFLTPPVE